MKKLQIISFLLWSFLGTSISLSQTDTLKILYISDTHSCLSASGPRDGNLTGLTGGIARAASLIGSEKSKDPNTLFLHGGDLFIGDIFFNMYFGVPELKILDALRCDGMVIGNHEFDLTPLTLLQALDSANLSPNFNMVSSNMKAADSSVCRINKHVKRFFIKQCGNIRVGFFGLTTPETNLASLPSPVFIDTLLIETAIEMIDSLKNNNCSVIICLSHLGVVYDKMIAANLPGIDLIFSGHDHYKSDCPVSVANPSGKNTLIIQAGAFYSDIASISLTYANGNISLLNYKLIELDNSIPEEPYVKDIVSNLIYDIENTYGPVFSQKITTASDNFDEVCTDPCGNGHKDTPIGNFVTDAFRNHTKTDIAIEVGGSTAQSICKGPVIGVDLFRVVGYGFNTVNGLGFRIATFNLSGYALMMGLEFGLANIENNDEYFIQCSGMSYSYDPKRNPFERVTDVTIAGKPLSAEKLYSVTANEFVPAFLNIMGIPYDNLKIIEDTTEFQILMEYSSARDTIIPLVEGRIFSKSSTTDVKHNIDVIPDGCKLYQNYPNPFNPETYIKFSIPAKQKVKISIYDITGKLVQILADTDFSAGEHSITWKAQNLSSGVYLYKLDTQNKSYLRKMVLLK